MPMKTDIPRLQKKGARSPQSWSSLKFVSLLMWVLGT